MVEITDTFICADEAGSRYTVFERTRFIILKLMDGSVEKKAGMVDYIIDSGVDLNRIDAETYQIVVSDKIIRKV